MEKESTISVKIADSIATKVVKGNFFQGCSGKQSDLKSSKESGITCMYPVARITPEANAFTIANKSFSGLRAGTARENNGRQTPIMLVASIEAMAMSFSFNDAALLWHDPSDCDSHSAARDGRTKEKMRTEIRRAWSLVEDAIGSLNAGLANRVEAYNLVFMGLLFAGDFLVALNDSYVDR